MKKIYIVYAHQRIDRDDGWGLSLLTIGIACNKKEKDTIIDNFRKEQQAKKCYWMDFHIDDNNNIICSTKKVENKYLY